MSEYTEKSRYDEGYDEGYEKGKKAMPTFTALTEHLNYLRLGGRWQAGEGVNRDEKAYLDGFVDAMRVLGMRT